MKKDDKASISLKKVISISIILLFVMGIGVMAASSKLNSVKIILSDGYEMDVLYHVITNRKSNTKFGRRIIR